MLEEEENPMIRWNFGHFSKNHNVFFPSNYDIDPRSIRYDIDLCMAQATQPLQPLDKCTHREIFSKSY